MEELRNAEEQLLKCLHEEESSHFRTGSARGLHVIFQLTCTHGHDVLLPIVEKKSTTMHQYVSDQIIRKSWKFEPCEGDCVGTMKINAWTIAENLGRAYDETPETDPALDIIGPSLRILLDVVTCRDTQRIVLLTLVPHPVLFEHALKHLCRRTDFDIEMPHGRNGMPFLCELAHTAMDVRRRNIQEFMFAIEKTIEHGANVNALYVRKTPSESGKEVTFPRSTLIGNLLNCPPMNFKDNEDKFILITFLVEMGADLGIPDETGETAWDKLSRFGKSELLEQIARTKDNIKVPL